MKTKYLKEDSIVVFKNWVCKVDITGHYSNGRTAIELIDAKDGEPVMMATVNLPEYPLGPDEVFIKNWSENEGILDVLVKAGILAPLNESQITNFVKVNKCRLLI